MRKQATARGKEYRSMKEFVGTFYPKSEGEKEGAEKTDPRAFGAKLAKELLNKYKHMLRA